MKIAVAAGIIGIVCISLVLVWAALQKKSDVVNPLAKNVQRIIEKPYERYSFDRLRDTKFEKSNIQIGEVTKNDDEVFTSRKFFFTVENKKVSGLINIPKKEGRFPVVVIFRGYVDKEIYTPGEGTRRTAEALTKNDFITLAPDFLGYGESDPPSEKSIEERFQTYTTALTLLSSMETINASLNMIGSSVSANTENVGIWGHSNGGQIALSVLAITGKDYPTVLWAPVSKMFPYSVLYFTDEFDDHGKALRRVIADFEKDYDVEKYSPTNYYSWIKAPIQLHQGTLDEAVPLRWSDQLYDELQKKEIDSTYFTYSGENHNFLNGSWPVALQRSVTFFNTYLK